MKLTNLLVYAALLSLPIGIAIATDVPDVKEGFWSIHTLTTNNPGNVKSETTTKICRNHAYDAYTKGLAKDIKGCTVNNESYAGNKYSMQMHCTVAATVIDSKGTVTFNGDTSTHSETQATYSPAVGGVSQTTTIQDQKYIGSCPTGTAPGDLILEDGNVNHLWKH
jgi:hypothetical protein